MQAIAVVDKGSTSIYDKEVQVSVSVDGYLEYCSHTHQTIQYETFNDGMDTEYGMNLAVCNKCGAGWDESGELRMEGQL